MGPCLAIAALYKVDAMGPSASKEVIYTAGMGPCLAIAALYKADAMGPSASKEVIYTAGMGPCLAIAALYKVDAMGPSPSSGLYIQLAWAHALLSLLCIKSTSWAHPLAAHYIYS
jgi:hypothetical protein